MEDITMKAVASIVGRSEEEVFRYVKEILEGLGDDYFTDEQLLSMLKNTRSRYVAEYAMRILVKRGTAPGEKH